MSDVRQFRDLASALSRNLIGIGLGLSLTACANGLVATSKNTLSMQQTTQFSNTPLTSAWVAPTGGLTAIARKLGPDSQQIIGLVNDTTLSGDNFLWQRARAGQSSGRFELKEFSEGLEYIPSPFSKISENNLQSTADSLGPIFWQEYAAGAQTNCVLAFRRIEANRRLMPHGTHVLDVMLRNCVQGSVAQALNPIRDTQISAVAISASNTASGGTRMLSPLAGPIPAP